MIVPTLSSSKVFFFFFSPECLAAESGLNHAPEDRGGDQIEQLEPIVQHLSHKCDGS